MSDKLRIGIIFGGRSVEHEVSIVTGYQVLEAIDHGRYQVTPIYIARDNVWYIGSGLDSIQFFRKDNPALNTLKRVLPCPNAARGKLILQPEQTGWFKRSAQQVIDVVIPATHGTFVEDGCLQGLLEMAGLPYAGSDVHASAIAMDKLLTKAALAAAGLPHLHYQAVTRGEFTRDPDAVMGRLETDPGYPLFIKPASLGSSIAVSRADDREKLHTALDLAVRFCERVLVEKALAGYREINCSVLDDDPPLPSVLEEPLSKAGLLDFDEKYRGGKKGGKGMAGQQRVIPAPLDDDTARHIQQLAVATYSAISAGGVARIDFLIDSDSKVFVNEINTIPGSLSFYLWEHMGRSFKDLLDRMIERASEIKRRQNRTTYVFESNLLAGRTK